MSGIDIFVAIISAVMLIGGFYLNVTSRRLAEQYSQSHKPEPIAQKAPVQRVGKK